MRDGFTVDGSSFSGKTVTFKAVGQTASGLLVLPNINYSLTFAIDLDKRTVTVGGCHDGYPSYAVTIDWISVYAFEQEILLALFGSCDTKVDVSALF